MTTIYGDPEVIYVTLDRRYRLANVHGSRAEAERERARDPHEIDVVEYVRRESEKEGEEKR